MDPTRLGVGVIGAGRVGPVMAQALAGAGHHLVGITKPLGDDDDDDRVSGVVPGVVFLDVPDLVERSELVIIAVPDSELIEVVSGIAATSGWQSGQIVAHTSIRHGLDVLDPARQAGAIPLALHPLMEFTGTSVDLVRMKEAWCVVSAPAVATPIGQALAVEMGMEPLVVAPEHREEIFQEFFQVDHSRKRRGALGLGLSIAKRIADILEHPLDVRSRVGEGSIFSIELPVGDILQSNIGEPEINERIGGEFVNLSVLVLEDDEILRGALAELLERWGIKVVAFNAFGDLAERIQDMEFQPDLIITDFRLHGGLKGNDVVGDIRRTLDRNVPAIVVTADTDPKLIEGIRQEGFPVLIKPVNPPRLRVMMHNILYEPHLVRELNLPDDNAEGASH